MKCNLKFMEDKPVCLPYTEKHASSVTNTHANINGDSHCIFLATYICVVHKALMIMLARNQYNIATSIIINIVYTQGTVYLCSYVVMLHGGLHRL